MDQKLGRGHKLSHIILIFSAVMFIYPASSWTEGIISSYAPLLAGRLKGKSVQEFLVLSLVPTFQHMNLRRCVYACISWICPN